MGNIPAYTVSQPVPLSKDTQSVFVREPDVLHKSNIRYPIERKWGAADHGIHWCYHILYHQQLLA